MHILKAEHYAMKMCGGGDKVSCINLDARQSGVVMLHTLYPWEKSPPVLHNCS